MWGEKNRETQIPKIRKFPIALVLAAGILTGFMGTAGGRSLILLGLGEFAFTIFSFFVLITLFNDIISGQSSIIRKIIGKIKAFFADEEIYFGVRSAKFSDGIKKFFTELFSTKPTPGVVPESDCLQDDGQDSPPDKTRYEAPGNLPGGLLEIKKDKTHEETGPEKSSAVLPVLYIVFFTGIACWRMARVFVRLPLSYSEQYGYSIANALLLLFLYCVIVIYLKITKDAARHHGDKTSFGMLTLLAYVSLVYAAFIGAHAVLGINILAVLQWTIYAAIIYLVAALALNILVSIFRNNVLKDFNYTVIPQTQKTGSMSSGALNSLDSNEVKINISLKSLYTFKFTLKILPGIILSLGFVLLLSTTVFIVKPHEEAAVYRLGKLERSSIVSQGLHFKLPWPIDRVGIYDVHRLKSLAVGSTSHDSMNFLWAQYFDRDDFLLLLGNGNEAVAAKINIVYKISDLYHYVTKSANPEAELTAAALRALMNRTVNTTLDAFLSVDLSLLSASILTELSAFCITENLGISVVQVIIENIHPPADVAEVYQRVATAFIDKNTIVTDARADAGKKIIDAQRRSRVAVDNAVAAQHRRVSAAQREMAVYYAAMEAYQVNPESFRLARYLDTFETVVNGSKVYVFSPGAEASITRSLVGQGNTLDGMVLRGVIP
jgi:membrane protease subunit HflK